MSKCKTTQQSHAEHSGKVMETRDHIKNGVSPKNHRSRGNFLICSLLLLAFWGLGNKAMGNPWPAGPNCIATLSGNILTISGTGEMYDYWSEFAPWCSHQGDIKTVIITEKITYIGSAAFACCYSLTNVTIKDDPGVLLLGGMAATSTCFSDCPITTLHLGKEIKFPNPMYHYTFQGKEKLTTLTFGNDVSSLPSSTFFGCTGLPSVEFPEKMKTFEESVFFGCSSLESIKFNATTGIIIGRNAFNGCGFKELVIPVSVTKIEESAFANCNNLTNLMIEDGTSILIFGGMAASSTCFYNCPIRTLHLGRNFNFSNTFYPYTFQGNTKLTTLIIGESVTEIPNDAFSECINLEQITSHPCKPPTIYSNTFSGVSKDIPVLIDCACVAAYRAANCWKDFKNYRNFNDNECPPPIVGIAEVTQESGLIIHPNPTTGELTITNAESQITEIEIFDMMGRNVETRLIASLQNGTIDISHLPNGVYFLRIQTENGVVTRKMVKR